MKFSKGCELERAASKEPGRYATHGVQVEREEDGSGVAVATNGRLLVVVPVELEPDDDLEERLVELGQPEGSRLIPRASWVEARRGAVQGEARAQLNGGVKAHGKAGVVSSPYVADGEFPRWRAVVPEADPNEPSIAFNASYLYDIQRALGADSVRLQLPTRAGRIMPTLPIRITGGQGYAVLMPITNDSEVPMRTARVDGAGASTSLAEVLRAWQEWDAKGHLRGGLDELRIRTDAALAELEHEERKDRADREVETGGAS